MDLRCWRCLSSASSEIFPLLYDRENTQIFYYPQSSILWYRLLFHIYFVVSLQIQASDAPLFFILFYFLLLSVFIVADY